MKRHLEKENTATQISVDFVNRLVRGICHDVGVPVRHIVQLSQLLKEAGIERHLNQKQAQQLGYLLDGGKQIQAMLTSLSTLPRLSLSAERCEMLALREIFDQVLSYHKQYSLPPEREIRLITNENWPDVVGSSEHWSLFFSSLIENAITFQPPELDHIIELKVYCNRCGNQLCFSLEDNGIGVSDEQKPQMTRAFKQLNGRNEYPGIGMGLTFCEYIADLHNGKIRYADADSGGLKVTYRQPLPECLEAPLPRLSHG